jgi:hypothetical protein
VNAPDRRYEDLQRRVENVERENAALRKLLEATRAEVAELRESPTAEPVGLAQAARIAGVSPDTIYRNPARYGGWKVDPSKPHSQWRFDPQRVRQTRGTVTVPARAERRQPRRSTVPLLPVKDRAA